MKRSVSRYFIFVLSFLLASLSIANAQNEDLKPSEIVIEDTLSFSKGYYLTSSSSVCLRNLYIPSNKEMSFELLMNDRDESMSGLFELEERLYDLSKKGLESEAPNLVFDFDDGTAVEFYGFYVKSNKLFNTLLCHFTLRSPEFFSYNNNDIWNTLFDKPDDKAASVRYLANCFSTKNIRQISIDDLIIPVKKNTASFLAQAIDYAFPGLVSSATTTQAAKSPVAATASTGKTVSPRASGMRVVDMGFPSGVKWADRNVGASNPEDYGDYYAWGETTPKAAYTWDNYAWGRENNLRKYNTTDKKLVLDPMDDIASVKLGSSWRMPTEEEMEELRKNCYWTLTTVNGVKGYELKSKINGNTIFLPAGGYYSEKGAILKGTSGYYWTSTLDESMPDSSEHLTFDDFSNKQYVFLKDRYIGMLVRPVTMTAANKPEISKPVQAPVASVGQASRQYHDALAFGLKGHVRKCEVVDEQDGSDATDPFCFKELGFVNDGRLSWWDYDGWEVAQSIFKDIIRTPQGSLDRFSYPTSYLSINYRFFYKGGKPYGLSISKFEEDSFLDILYGPELETTIVIWSDTGKDSFCVKKRVIKDRSKEIDKIIEEEFSKGGDILGGILRRIPDKNLFSSFPDENYVIKEKDLHGNPTAFTRKEDGRTIRRTITYWDDEPATVMTTQATEKPKAIPTPKPEPKPIITEKTPGLRPATPKELSVQDLITRPFGVLSQNSRKLSRNQLLYDLSDYGWVDKDQNNLKINLRASDGYDMVFLGKVPNWAYSEFEYDYDTLYYDTENTALIRFGYQFTFDKRKEAERFIHQIVDLLKAEGINMIKVKKYHAFKGRFKNSEIYLSNSADPNAIFLFISYKVLGNWIQ